MPTLIETPAAEDLAGANDLGMHQIVGFRLGKEEYGIEISNIREIILMCEITSLPDASEHMEGVINLRNSVVPIIDMRSRFGFPKATPTEESRIMVVNVGTAMIGIIVDAVSEVLKISRDSISPPPPTVAGLGKDYIIGLALLEQSMLILLDISKVLRADSGVACEAATVESLSSCCD